MALHIAESDIRARVHRLERVLDRLLGEWREIRPLLGLRVSSTWSEVSESLGVDRGTAQRLVRLGRADTLSARDLELFPGAKAWQAVVKGAGNQLGDDHPLTQRLASACDRYEEVLNQFGGSRAAAWRQIQRAGEAALAPGPVSSADARRQVVESMAEYMGYSIDLRFDLMLMRLNPAQPTRLDLAMVNCFLGCSGRPGAMPFATSRFAVGNDGSPVQDGDDGRSFILLQSGTSSPTPGLLSTGDATVQTIIVEPEWTEHARSIDLSIMKIVRDAQDSPWLEAPLVYSAETLIRHPTRRMVFQWLVHRDLLLDARASFGAFSTRRTLAVSRPWFDRLPGAPELHADPPPFKVIQPRAFSRYHAVMDEVFRRLGWDPEPFHSFTADVESPLPLAWYSFELERPG